MKLTRRDFLKISSAATAGLALSQYNLGFAVGAVEKHAWSLRTVNAQETPTICCYCAVGCGIICHTNKKSGQVIYTEGDADHPINGGSLCAKGAAAYQVAQNEKRVTEVMYRAPYSDKWEVKTWDWALQTIAKRVKKSRDESFTANNTNGELVNRTNGIASVGSAALDNEECWIYQAMLRALGLVYIEHQARI